MSMPTLPCTPDQIESFLARPNPGVMEKPGLMAKTALFNSANGFAGCIPGILEILHRQGLTPSNLCLNPHERLSSGQAEELTRVCRTYPEPVDDAFAKEHRNDWLA